MQTKNVIGAIIMSAVILVSIPIGVRRSMDRECTSSSNAYYYDETGYAIYQGLDIRREAAHNLITVAEKYLDDNPGLDPYIDNLQHQADVYVYDERFVREAQWNQELTYDMEALYVELGKVTLSDKDAQYRRSIMADFESEQHKIERSSYNDDARSYNAKLREFPVNLLRHISGVSELGVFDSAPGDRSPVTEE